ncbi:GMC family oxidoreductase [Luteimonas sp. A501]
MTHHAPAQAEYDYVIIGAGSAGCVLAERLSQSGEHSVLLVEAGPEDDDMFIPMPMGLFKTFLNPERIWGYAIEPDPATGKQHFWVRGKMIGGSSSINGMLYFRGQPQDYDGWESDGCAGWGWSQMRRVFRTLENHELGDDGLRGVGGPLDISVQKERSPLTEAIIRAGQASGLDARQDLNREEQEGIGYSTRTLKNGRRVSASTAFLRPARRRANVTVRSGTFVNRILFEGTRAVGIACAKDGAEMTYRARREVILSAGALQSPVILQHSGVGPRSLLERFGIPVVADRDNVGRNAREHKMITIISRVRAHSLNREFRGLRKYWNGLRYFLTSSGPMTSTYDINAFVRSSEELDRPDAQLTFWAISPKLGIPTYEPDTEPGLGFMGYPLRSDSQGVIEIKSADPRDPPSIQANFLTTEHDRKVIVNLFRYARRLLAQTALKDHIVEELHPGPAVQTDEEIIAACHQDGTCLHTVGTCRMGADKDSVVDARLRVRGVEGLRVVDCSIMPTQVSGNTNGPVMAVAWRAAEMILEDAH